MPPPELIIDNCFDRAKVRWLVSTLPMTYAVLDKKAPWVGDGWPRHLKCMSSQKIIEGRARGAGHGYTYTRGEGSDTIWMNPDMTKWGHWLVFVHENLHHAYPDATEKELNCRHLPHVFKKVFGRKLEAKWARSHGVGSPVPGVGDRSYCK